MAGERADKKWDSQTVDLPGLNSGFPEGITEYLARLILILVVCLYWLWRRQNQTYVITIDFCICA